MEKLSEKVDYLHQEQLEMEASHEAIREDMEKLRAGKSLFSDITKEAEMNSGEEATEKNVMTQLLEMLKGQRQDPVNDKKYPIPVKNGNFALNSGDERQMQKIFDQVKSKSTRIEWFKHQHF